MNRFFTFFFFLFYVEIFAQPQRTPKVLTDFVDRIGGKNAHKNLVLIVDKSICENGNDVFKITSEGGKPCIIGNNYLAVTTGLNWFLNHQLHINLSWNNGVKTSFKHLIIN